jgi:hypothetical protein
MMLLFMYVRVRTEKHWSDPRWQRHADQSGVMRLKGNVTRKRRGGDFSW